MNKREAKEFAYRLTANNIRRFVKRVTAAELGAKTDTEFRKAREALLELADFLDSKFPKGEVIEGEKTDGTA